MLQQIKSMIKQWRCHHIPSKTKLKTLGRSYGSYQALVPVKGSHCLNGCGKVFNED